MKPKMDYPIKSHLINGGVLDVAVEVDKRIVTLEPIILYDVFGRQDVTLKVILGDHKKLFLICDHKKLRKNKNSISLPRLLWRNVQY